MNDKELSALKALAEAVPQENWERDGRTVYALQHAGWRKGMEQLENRFYFSVQPGRGMSEGDAEAIAELMVAANPSVILSLISRVERAERALIRGGYEDMGGEEWKPPIGEPPRFIEVATPARDVGGLTEARNSAIEEVAKLMESSDDHIWANTCGRKIRALATSPAPSVKQEAVNAEQIARKVRELTLDYAAMHFDGKSRLISPAYVSEYLRELKNAPLDVSVITAAPSASQGEVKVPEGFAIVPVEPTPAMLIAGVKGFQKAGYNDCDKLHDWTACYRAMIAAAPAPSVMDRE